MTLIMGSTLPIALSVRAESVIWGGKNECLAFIKPYSCARFYRPLTSIQHKFIPKSYMAANCRYTLSCMQTAVTECIHAPFLLPN